MATPNQGPPPGPPPGTNTNPDPDPDPGPNLPVRDIDLSDPVFTSDGILQQHQATVDVEFFGRLSELLNRESNFVTTLGYTVNFIGGLPQGYVPETRVSGTRNDGSVALDYFVHGHPNGRSFRPMTQFARHVYHIMRNDLPNCDCSLC